MPEIDPKTGKPKVTSPQRTTGIGNWKDRPVPGMFDGDPKGTGVDTTSIGDAQKERNKLLEHMFNKRAYPGEEGKPDSIEDLLRTNPAINPYPKDDWTKEIEDKVKNKPDGKMGEYTNSFTKEFNKEDGGENKRKIRKAKKKIRKAGNKPGGGPGFLDEETGKWVDDGSNFGRKGRAAIRKLRKAGYTEEQIEQATGADGWSSAMDWANSK